MTTTQEILSALIAEGFADNEEDATAQLEDMGFELSDLPELWELGGE